MKKILLAVLATSLLTSCSFGDKNADEKPVPNVGQEFQQPQSPIE